VPGTSVKEKTVFRSFFLNKKWALWAWPGVVLILAAVWYQVQVSVQINDWYGGFYDYLQKILGKPGTTTVSEFYAFLWTFGKIAVVAIIVAVFVGFFTKHWIFRWRTAMTEYYETQWHKVRHIEGASQRVQEDTAKFSSIMQGLGVSFMRSIMTLVAFLPILLTLSGKVTELPFLGKVDGSLVYVALLSAIGGTTLLMLAGIRLPGLEFNNQLTEAAYRKELVLGEDDPGRAHPPELRQLWSALRANHFRLFFNYLYFDVAKWSYLQFSVLIPLIALAPTLVAGVITLGVFQQISNAFDRVENSFQYLVNSWETIVELISVYKRLRAFEQTIANAPDTPASPDMPSAEAA
jgi:peptide/bleomycin uptake transporter